MSIFIAKAIDITGRNVLFFLTKREVINASILCKVSYEERDAESPVHNHEKWQTSNSGCMPNLRNQDVQDWEKLVQFTKKHRRAGFL